ncbi:MAG: hypothetical protein CM15mP100_2720 [Alphaproteobacteria bacterium]|nr:MAG: hypothetical protein CM15mP100_2720 [Alphaproteobacteria bacterium]
MKKLFLTLATAVVTASFSSVPVLAAGGVMWFFGRRTGHFQVLLGLLTRLLCKGVFRPTPKSARAVIQ